MIKFKPNSFGLKPVEDWVPIGEIESGDSVQI